MGETPLRGKKGEGGKDNLCSAAQEEEKQPNLILSKRGRESRDLFAGKGKGEQNLFFPSVRTCSACSSRQPKEKKEERQLGASAVREKKKGGVTPADRVRKEKG